MKDLFVPPTPTSERENFLPDSERSSSVIRHMSPEDPYDDTRSYRSMHSSIMAPPPRPTYGRAAMSHDSYGASASTYAPSSRPMSRQQGGGLSEGYPLAPPSRHSSNTSSILSGGSSHNGGGSENWETYSSTSENEEMDATEAYYAKVRAHRLREQQLAHQQMAVKRPGTATGMGQLGASKKVREQVIAEEGAFGAEGSEAGWTDDGDVGDTY